MVVLVYTLIVVIDCVVLGVTTLIGYPIAVIGSITGLITLILYSWVACSDPGMVYKSDFQPRPQITSDIEDGTQLVSSEITVPSQSTIECTKCQIQRPYSARHCHYCNVCIDSLDHHCPWCGKCIGKNNLAAFNMFVSAICFQIYFLIGALIYFILAYKVFPRMPRGPY